MTCIYAVEEALPHAAPMVLLDEILSFDEERIETTLVIRKTAPFYCEEGMPAHVNLEYMAQTCGAKIGVEALSKGQPPRIGLLLGTRNFHAERPWLNEGECLIISASVVYRDEEMGVFDCQVLCGDEKVASAQVTAYHAPEGWEEGMKDG